MTDSILSYVKSPDGELFSVSQNGVSSVFLSNLQLATMPARNSPPAEASIRGLDTKASPNMYPYR